MNNPTAFIIALIVIAALIADYVLDWGGTGFLTGKVLDLIGWLAVWR